MLTVKDIATKFKVQPATVRDWAKKRKIPVTYLPSGELRFDETKINEWIEKRTIKSRNVAA